MSDIFTMSANASISELVALLANSGLTWELIETITLAEAAVTVIRNSEPDETPYNFKGLFIKASTAIALATEEVRVYYRFDRDDTAKQVYSRTSSGLSANTRFWTSKCVIQNGYWDVTATAAQTAATLATALSAQMFSGQLVYPAATYPAIEEVSIFSTNAETPLPIGSVFEIWGLR